jgi:hypothetical protein
MARTIQFCKATLHAFKNMSWTPLEESRTLNTQPGLCSSCYNDSGSLSCSLVQVTKNWLYTLPGKLSHMKLSTCINFFFSGTEDQTLDCLLHVRQAHYHLSHAPCLLSHFVYFSNLATSSWEVFSCLLDRARTKGLE